MPLIPAFGHITGSAMKRFGNGRRLKGEIMKKPTVLILLLFLAGCGCTTTSYSYKAGVPFDRANLQQAPDVGISMHNNQIKGLKAVMKEDILTFAEAPLRFHDLPPDIILTPDNLNIPYCAALRNRYPGIEYVMATLEHDPVISQHSREIKDWQYNSNKKDFEWKATGRQELETVMTVHCEIMLFNLKDCMMIAKADKNFRETARKCTTHFPSDTWLGFTILLLESALGYDPYPKVGEVGSYNAIGHFYFFLKHIHYPESYDPNYFKLNLKPSEQTCY
jgi:hypothetical protein